MKNNLHKKYTFEDRLDRRYACWRFNEHKAFAWWKRYNRKKYRRMLKKELDSDIKTLMEGDSTC